MSKLHSPPPEKERTISKPKKRREDSENPTHGSVERSEEHTSELQSQSNLVCRLLLAQTNASYVLPCRRRPFTQLSLTPIHGRNARPPAASVSLVRPTLTAHRQSICSRRASPRAAARS